MMLSKVLRSGGNGLLSFKCPGCKTRHTINTGDAHHVKWGWDGNVDNPTFTPSIRVTSHVPSDNPDEFDDPSKDVAKTCHSFIRNGVFAFLDDCTHELAGQHVPMIPWDSLKD